MITLYTVQARRLWQRLQNLAAETVDDSSLVKLLDQTNGDLIAQSPLIDTHFLAALENTLPDSYHWHSDPEFKLVLHENVRNVLAVWQQLIGDQLL